MDKNVKVEKVARLLTSGGWDTLWSFLYSLPDGFLDQWLEEEEKEFFGDDDFDE